MLKPRLWVSNQLKYVIISFGIFSKTCMNKYPWIEIRNLFSSCECFRIEQNSIWVFKFRLPTYFFLPYFPTNRNNNRLFYVILQMSRSLSNLNFFSHSTPLCPFWLNVSRISKDLFMNWYKEMKKSRLRRKNNKTPAPKWPNYEINILITCPFILNPIGWKQIIWNVRRKILDKLIDW